MDTTSLHHVLTFHSLYGFGCREGQVAGALALESTSRLCLSAVEWALSVSREARRGFWGKAEVAPEFLGMVARTQLNVRFMVPKVAGTLGHIYLQSHSSSGRIAGLFWSQGLPCLEGWCFSLWVPTIPHPLTSSRHYA